MEEEGVEYAYELKIPKERVAVLIGKQGEVKKQIEQATKTQLEIDSAEGDVKIKGKNALLLYLCREIIRAIGRGFNPEIAMLLLKQDYGFEVLTLTDYARSKSDMERLKGRVIGEGGKARKVIEELTGCNISVYGKTVSIIGRVEDVPFARRAIESLLRGSKHATVYRWLEKHRKKARLKQRFDIKE